MKEYPQVIHIMPALGKCVIVDGLSPGPRKRARAFAPENAPLERFHPGCAGVGAHPCNVLTPYPSPRAFIASTTAIAAAAVVK